MHVLMLAPVLVAGAFPLSTDDATYHTCLDSAMTADAFNLMLNAGDAGGWSWGDGAVPVQWGDDKLVLFGDSVVGDTFVNNTILRVSGNCVSSPGPRPVFTSYVPGQFYWPADGYTVGDRLYVSLEEVRSTGEQSIFGFESVDVDYAAVSLDGSFAHPGVWESGPWDNTELGQLSTAHVDSDPALVNFRAVEPGSGFYGSYLARMSDLSDPSQPWLWWDGERFQDDPTQVVGIAPMLGFFDDRILHPVEYDGGWWATTWAFGYGSYTVMSAPSPHGPWTVVCKRPTEGVAYLYALTVWDDELVLRHSRNDPAMQDRSLMRPSFTTSICP